MSAANNAESNAGSTNAGFIDVTALDSLLSMPAMADMSRQLRQLLHAEAGTGPAQLNEPISVLSDVIELLGALNADEETLVAAVLQAVPDWRRRLTQKLKTFHPAVEALVDGQQAATQVWALHAEQATHGNAEGLRRLLLSIVRDLRVVPILLARQLARLRIAHRLPDAERLALAQLTRDLHAPLANRLGIGQLKWELEDLAFRYLEPSTYQRIARLLDEKRVGRESYVSEVAAGLEAALTAQGIAANVVGRPKHIYSIWRKMQKKNAPISELYDLRALRVQVEDIPACYAALGVAHALWVPIPNEFDDYIARPKNNDYRSLHTAVIGPEGKTLEVQIRTHEMHRQAELGVAAHWRYKESGGSQRSSGGESALNRKIEWMRRMLETHSEDHANNQSNASEKLRAEFDSALLEDRIYALTPQGEVIDLPQGATPLDFAYYVHTMVGHRCRGAKVDGRIVPLGYRLQTGDRVEILTGKTAEPRRAWLIESNGFLASPRSREKVRNWFNKLDRERNLQAGKELLDKDLRRLGLLQTSLAPALQKFNVDSIDELHILVALGDVSPHQIGRYLLDHERSQQEAQPNSQLIAVTQRTPKGVKKQQDAIRSGFTIEGVGNLLVQIARCCRPLPGEEIFGYVTRSRGVTVHRADCAAYQRLAASQPQRALPMDWGQASRAHEANVLIEAIDRKWLLKDMTNLIAQENAHVLGITSDIAREGHLLFRLRLRVDDFGHLSRLLGKIDGLPGVQKTRRV